jgi:nitrile hydratase
MNGVHDMGGMHGLGPIAPEPDEPIFHAAWEGRVLALTLAVGAWGRWNIDASRHARERIPGPDYLRMSYYEKWLAGLVEMMVTAGLVTGREIEAGEPAKGGMRASPPLTADRVATALAAGGPASRDVPAPRRFAIGETVRARNLNPAGHTRLPRYARGRKGVIERDHGPHVFPDANALGLGEQPARLYGVRFSARELWGEAAGARDSVHLDLWDAYLEHP